MTVVSRDDSASVGSGRVARILLSWSSGKDSAWTLNVLKNAVGKASVWKKFIPSAVLEDGSDAYEDIEIVGLLTTVNEKYKRVAMHAIKYGWILT